METFSHIIKMLNDWLWGPPLLILLIGTHLYLTFRTGFIQRKLGLGIKLTFARDRGSPGDIVQFGALVTALSSTIGTGNIIGVGTAIASGGPGRAVVDVAYRRVRHCYQVLRKLDRCKIQSKKQ